jgi:hypothetical protein
LARKEMASMKNLDLLIEYKDDPCDPEDDDDDGN